MDPRAWGIEPRYRNYRGESIDVAPETIDAVMDALGAEGAAPPEADVIVLHPGKRVPEEKEAAEVLLEDGTRRLTPGTIPSNLPLGYHRLVMWDGSERSLIVSPGRCYLPEELDGWGWALQLYAARSADSWGMGDLADLKKVGGWARSHGAGFLLLNPLNAAAPGPGQQSSPYFPSSRCYRNPLYIAVEDVPGASELASDLDALARAGRLLNQTDTLDRDEIYRVKLDALEELFERAPDDDRFERYRAEQGDSLRDFAAYMVLAETHGPGTNDWPTEYARCDSAATGRFTHEHEERLRFHEWLQWLLEEQLRAAEETIDLIHDLPIGVDAGGADAWIWRDAFALGAQIGAPPDEFSATGQDWGLPPFDPWKLRARAYEPFIRTIRAGLASGAGLRIDHVMGLFRLWWIPEGADPTEGAYVRYPHEDLLDIVALESHRARSYVVGEDLGTVEPLVREEMQARQMLSYRVMWFEDREPEEFPELALAAVTNHDLPTTAGLWTRRDLQAQKELDIEVDDSAQEKLRDRLLERCEVSDHAPVEAVIEKIYGALSRTPSRLRAATLEDACGVEERPNQPGTTDERPNWSLPLPFTIEELEDLELPKAIAAALNRD